MVIDQSGNLCYYGRGFLLGAVEIADKHGDGIVAAVGHTEITDIVMGHQLSPFIAIAASCFVGEKQRVGV